MHAFMLYNTLITSVPKLSLKIEIIFLDMITHSSNGQVHPTSMVMHVVNIYIHKCLNTTVYPTNSVNGYGKVDVLFFSVPFQVKKCTHLCHTNWTGLSL